MKSETISAIHDFSLKARELMLKEVDEQLEGIYGLLPNGKFEPAEKYPAIKNLEEAQETRKRLEQFIADEEAAGISSTNARSKLAMEIAFTRINRMVALKMMETRGLIRQSVGKGVDSNGFKRWVVQNDKELEKYEAGDLPQNAIGEGPRQEAYRHYLLLICAELSTEINVLFNPDNLPSRIFPRPRVLNQLIAMMNDEDLDEAWEPGGEELLGWVYQFFNENEKKDVFNRLYNKKQKIKKEDIPAATELFTPNWIVKWLIQNSIGRHWIQMHPDSRLAESLDYLVPLAGEIPPVPFKKVADIKMLDPACGTMHFGLVAFEIFYEMYREELENAGKERWSDKPSVDDETEIPAAIIANNIHGIDIDLRAVQLSALALFIKAKSTNKDAVINKSNLGCADVIRFDRSKLEKFITQLDIKDSVYARILKGIWEELENLGLAGSLVRIEYKLVSLIEEEKLKYKKDKQPSLPGFAEEQFETEAGKEEFWEIIGIQIRQAIEHYVKSEIEKGRLELLFANETQKGFHVLDILNRRYDVVVTNPPYLYRRNMDPNLAKFLEKKYPESKGDLYTAFIERCAELLADQGRLAMITQQSFLYISSYKKMRKGLFIDHSLETMCHLGPKAFEAISGEKVNTVLFALRRESKDFNKSCATGIYFRLVQEADAKSKRTRYETALNNLRNNQQDPLVYHYNQRDFCLIPREPLVYWINKKITQIFSEEDSLEKIAKPRAGLQTGMNERFLRFWWEVGLSSIARHCRDEESAYRSNKKWFPYMKGGGFQRWYGNQEYVVNYKSNAAELESFRPASVLRNRRFYFQKGITWSDLTTGRFAARLSPGGFVFDVKGSSAFTNNIPLILSILNSSFAHYILSLLNPTASFQVGDLSRLPVPNSSSSKLSSLVTQAINLSKAESQESETTYDFLSPPDWEYGIQNNTQRFQQLTNIETSIEEEVYYLYGIERMTREAIETELSGYLSDEINGKPKKNKSVNTSLTDEILSKKWISYAVGIVLNRFQPGTEQGLGYGSFQKSINKELKVLTTYDGILVMDRGHIDNFPERVYHALCIMLGEKDTESVTKNATGKEGAAEDLLHDYLERSFFKEHIKQYRKRPVYWLLQSPKKKYGIWIFHEKLNLDTLYRIRDKYVEPKINHTERQISGLRNDRDSADGRRKREIGKQINEFTDVLDDVREFEKLIRYISEERRYTPHIDDGILLNMAPLWELIPSWQAEPKKAWKALKRGDYDWTYQAMDHWPERVKEKCKTNKSFAIAHGLDQ